MTIRRLALGAILFVLVIGAFGFFALPQIVKSTLIDTLSEALHRPVSVESISINPYTLSAQVAGLAIQERGPGETGGGETVAGFDSLFFNIELSSLFHGGPVISELKLVGPSFRIVRLADGRFNFSDLIDEFMAKPASDDPTPPFALNNIQISGGKIEFDDRVLGEKHLISELNIALPFVSSLPSATEIFVEPAFSASIDGSPLVIKGKSKPFANSRESELAFDLRDVHLGKYLDYAPMRLPVEVISGALDTDLKLSFGRHENHESALSLSGRVTIRDLMVKDTSGAPLLSWKRLEVLVDTLDPLRQKVVIDRVAVDSPEIHARVSRQGTINWVDFFSREAATREPSATEVKAKPAPVDWSLGEAKISGGIVRWLDESHGKPFNASVEGIDLDLKKLDGKSAIPAKFEVAWHLQAGEWAKVDAVSIKGGRLDLARREVAIEQLTARAAKLLLRRAASGGIEFVEPPALRIVKASQKDSSQPWKLTVAKYRADDVGIRFEDHAVSPAVTHTIEAMSVEADNLSTEPGQTARVSTRFRLNRTADVEVGGSVKVSPLETDLKVAIKSLELLPLQPYFTERLNIEVTRGQLTLNGGVQLRQTRPGGSDADKLSGGFSGQVTLGDFYAVDKINSADFLKWKSLYLGHLDLRLNPNSVAIGEIALTDFFARVILSREGKLNLLQIVRQANAAPVAVVPAAVAAKAPELAAVAGDGKSVAPVPAVSNPLLPVNIGKITLQGGDIRFTDNFVKPNYSANLKKVGGTISGLSSAADSVASLELRGSYDNIAPLSIKARLNPLAASPFLDLEADIKGIELTSLSPYSGKYAGYAIEKGKLSLFVKYKIENHQLTAENRIFLDQLTFGDPVDSPDATKLPVTLAVALLRNRNGEIDINLPIAGSLDDPDFSVGGLVVKMIVNLLAKAVTAPFALLGSMFGGGEELSNIDFDFGQAVITPPAQPRLEKLAKALLDRPALRLEIEGRADPEVDAEGLKRDRLESKVRALKRGDLTKKGVENGALDGEPVEVSAKEYPSLLERVYRAEKFPKPRNLVGMVKGLPVEEMEKLILANSAVDEEDLRDLAERRGRGVRDWLVAHEVPGERLFILPVKVGKADGKSEQTEQAKGNRVLFSLK
ncbi:DUF748 domain-containing protein [Candidatus Accumulibacter aalborgensis]|nr:DUF748 domain-containing protein [Candidatus Accumulibacter aalborgensis]